MKEPMVVKFGKRVRDERIKKSLSQEQLAEKANVHRTYIGMVERGEKNITLSSMEKIAKALGIELHNLLKV